jgi:hypothetical protein
MRQIVEAVRARVMAVTGFPAERVVPHAGADEVPYPTMAEQYVLLRAKGGKPDLDQFHGAGRVDARYTRVIRATLWTRLALDAVNFDTGWMLAQSTGHLDVEHQLLDALVGFLPKDGDANVLVTQPFAPGPVTDPRRGEKDPHWGVSAVEAEATFTLDLDQTYCSTDD